MSSANNHNNKSEFEPVFAKIYAEAVRTSGCHYEVYEYRVAKAFHDHMNTLSEEDAARFRSEAKSEGVFFDDETLESLKSAHDDVLYADI